MPVRLSCFRFIGFANFVESQPQPVNCLFSVFNIRREPDCIARETASASRKAASICRDCDSGFRDVNTASRETDSIVRTADSIRSDRDSIVREPDSTVRDLATGQNSTARGIREAESGCFLNKRPVFRHLRGFCLYSETEAAFLLRKFSRRRRTILLLVPRPSDGRGWSKTG